jgi:uncharacterized membrane protein
MVLKNNKKGLLLAGQGNSKKVIVAAILLGVGLAGLIDTIVFHEILQWHHMVSNKIQPNIIDTLRLNVLWDGLFLTIALVVTIVGVGLRSAAHKRETFPIRWEFIGLLLFSFGLFNIIEGIINHHILSLHHVKDDPNPLIWDSTFLAITGVLFIGIGWALMMRKSTHIVHQMGT